MATREIKYELTIDAARARQATDQYAQYAEAVEKRIADAKENHARQFGALMQARERRMAREREELAAREEERRKELAGQAEKAATELVKRREALIIAGIEDEKERRLALIDLQFNQERKRIEELLRLRLQAGEITRQQHRQQMAELDQVLDQARATRVADVEQRFGAGLGDIEQGSYRAQQAVLQLGRGIEQASAFTTSWQSGLRGVSVQLIPMTNDLLRLRSAAQASGQTMTQSLLGALKGPAGIATLLGVAASAAVLFGDKLVAHMNRGAEAAEEARRRIDEVYGSILQISRAQVRLGFDDRGLELAISATESRIEQLKALQRSAEAMGAAPGPTRGREFEASLELAASAGDAAAARTLETIRQLREEAGEATKPLRELLSTEIAGREARLEILRKEQQLTSDLAQAQEELAGLGARALELEREVTRELMNERQSAIEEETERLAQRMEEAKHDADLQVQIHEAYVKKVAEINADFDERERRAREQAANKAERDRKEQERKSEEFARTVAQARLETLGTALQRELEQIRATEAERLRIVAGNAEAEDVIRQASALRTLAVLAQAEQRRRDLVRQAADADAELEDRRRLLTARTEEERAAIEEANLRRRSERLAARLAEEEDVLNTTRARARELTDEELELLAEMERGVEELRRAREDAELSAEEAAQRRRRREEEAERQHVERMRAIRERHRRALGETDAAIRRDRIAAIEAELAAEGTSADRRRQLYEELYGLQVEQIEDLRRRAEAFRQEVERYARTLIDAVSDAARPGDQRSDAEIRQEQRRLAQQEQALKDSLRRREITQAEFNDRMQILAERRAEFEKDVESERAGFVERLTSNLTDVVIQEGERLLAQLIAQGLTQLLFSKSLQAASVAATTATMQAIAAASATAATLVATASFGGAAAAGAAGIASAIATVKALAMLPAFASGGVVHGGEKIIRVNERGPEFVVNAEATRGNERALYILQRQLARGVRLDDLLTAAGIPPYAEGGLTAAAAVVTPAPLRMSASGRADQSPMLAELRAIRVEQEATRRRIGELDDNQQRALDAQATKLGRVVADPHAARRQRILAARQDRVINPRGGVL